MENAGDVLERLCRLVSGQLADILGAMASTIPVRITLIERALVMLARMPVTTISSTESLFRGIRCGRRGCLSNPQVSRP